MLRRVRWLFAVVSLACAVSSCSKGGECETCSTDEDCNGGLLCTRFSDGSQRCGSGEGRTTCRVR